MRDRFWTKVRMGGSDECWNWTASVIPGRGGGYGRFGIAQKVFYAHRVAWEFVNGEVPDGLSVLHTCDNPSCCNPAHLFLGTQSDNMRDMWMKRRHSVANPRGRLTPKQVEVLREEWKRGRFTQKKLAMLFGVSQSSVCRLTKERIQQLKSVLWEEE